MATPSDAEYQAAMKRLGMTDDPDYKDSESAEGEGSKKKKKKKKPSGTIGGFLDQAAKRHKMLHDL